MSKKTTGYVLLATIAIASVLTLLYEFNLAPIPASLMMVVRWVTAIVLVWNAIVRKGLTTWILTCMVLGIFVGLDFPDVAKALQPYKQYDVQVEEIHHIHKLDAPSGTAITIAEGILDNSDVKTNWVNTVVGEQDELIPKPQELLIESHRIEEVPGTHTVLYSSEVDQIEFKHTAHSRDGFALGAVVAAEWLNGKKGFYQVTEIFDFNK